MKEIPYSRMRRPRAIYILIISLCILVAVLVFLRRIPPRHAVEGFATIPRIIWSYWHDPQIPPKVKQILDDRREVLSGWEHRVLNETTVYDYIPRDEFPKGYETLGQQHKADWIRLYLLKIYAGCWMDASIIVNRSTEIEELYEESLLRKSQLTGYSIGNSSYIETFLLMAPMKSTVISPWFDEYTSAIEYGFAPYKKKVSSKVDLSQCFSGEDDTYLITTAALLYTLQVILPEEPPMVLKHRDESMLKYHVECNNDNKCVVEKIRNTPKHLQPPNLKLTRFNREFL